MQENQATVLQLKDYLNPSSDDIEKVVLNDCRNQSYQQILSLSSKLQEARNLVYSLEEKCWRAKEVYKFIDYDLALVDGRYQKLQSKAEEEKKAKEESTTKLLVKLNKDQIQRIAEILGVELGGDEE